MALYRKKPVVIEAALFDGVLVGEPRGDGKVEVGTCPPWFPAVVEYNAHPAEGQTVQPGAVRACDDGLLIGTLEGTHLARPGDMIIQGVKGELYPCKPDIFGCTYEKVDG